MVVGLEYRHGLGLGPQNLETWMVNWYSKGGPGCDGDDRT
jgi:hypothetical protein